MVKRVFLVGVMVAVTAIAVTAPSADAAGPYRRWTTPKPFTCATTASGVEVQVANLDVEYGGGLPADAEFTVTEVVNGAPTTIGPSTVEQTTGTRSASGITRTGSAYPLTLELAADTIVDGEVVYESTLSIACTADAADSAFAVNQSATPDPYRRWTSPKGYSCEEISGGLRVTIDDQDVEFNEVPSGATYRVVTDVDGVVTTSGPFPVEQPSGTLTGAPYTVDVADTAADVSLRLDTIVDGVDVHRSTLAVSCSGDVTGTVVASNAVVPPPTTTSTTTTTTTTTTTSVPPTSSTTTSVASTSSSTTVAGGSPSSSSSTSTTVRRTPTTVRRTPTTVRRRTAATGAATVPSVLLGVGFLGIGAAMIAVARRRDPIA